MGELEKYGLLSLGSIAVLFLVLTFVGREPRGERDWTAAAYPEMRGPPAGEAPAPRSVADGRPRLAAPSVEPDDGPADDLAAGEDFDATGGDEVGEVPPPPITAAAAPAPLPAARAPAARRPRVYEVRAGDTLSEIAQRVLGSARRWPELAEANPGLDPKRLRVGQKLIVPPERGAAASVAADTASPEVASPTVAAPKPRVRPKPERPRPSASRHTVQGGDTLSAIALRYYGDAMMWKDIQKANPDKVSRSGKIRAGTILELP